MDRHPVLNGMLYDQGLKKKNAVEAISLIKEGWNVRDALSKCHSSYSSIREFGYEGSGRQCPRKTIKKVKKCIDKINSGGILMFCFRWNWKNLLHELVTFRLCNYAAILILFFLDLFSLASSSLLSLC